jgi:tRNA 2-thiouridine synthesizing protein B
LLHIVNKSPFSDIALESCIRAAQKGDSILLIEDAVLGVMAGGKAEPIIQQAQKDTPIYALEPDLKARGVDRRVDGVKAVDYAGFVELVEKEMTMSWL